MSLGEAEPALTVAAAPPPVPRQPSAWFTWGWRTTFVTFVAGFIVIACLGGGMPEDALLQWRVAWLGAGAAAAGGAGVLFWAWAARPRLSLAEARLGTHKHLSREQNREINRALRRGTWLSPGLRPWARARAAGAQAAVPTGLALIALGGANALNVATSDLFPDWLNLATFAFALLFFTPLIAHVRRQQHHADHLDGHPATAPTDAPGGGR